MSDKPITIEVFENHLDLLDQAIIVKIVEKRLREKLKITAQEGGYGRA